MNIHAFLQIYCVLFLLMNSSISIVDTMCNQKSSCLVNDSCIIVDNITRLILQFKTVYPIEVWKRYGLFSDDYIDRINVHWLKFPPPETSTHYLLAALYGIIMILGFTGNALVIFMFIRLVAQKILFVFGRNNICWCTTVVKTFTNIF